MKIKKKLLRSYREALASKGNSIKIENDETQQTIEGTITRINQDVQNGNTFYYLTIEMLILQEYLMQCLKYHQNFL